MERRDRLLTAVCAGGALLMAQPASAAPPATTPVPTGSAEATSPEARAAASFQRALTLYDAGDLRGALEAMREAWQLSSKNELFYNIARLEHELDLCVDARTDYLSYLELVPGGTYRIEAERAVQELSTRCPPAGTSTPASPVTPPAAPSEMAEVAAAQTAPLRAAPRPGGAAVPEPAVATTHVTPWPPAPVGYGAIGLGVVAGASSLFFLQQALEARSELQAGVDREWSGGARANLEKQAEQDRNEAWAKVLAVTGGALVAGGIVLVVLAPNDSARAAGSAKVELGLGRLSFTKAF